MTLSDVIKEVSKKLDVNSKLTSGFVYETVERIREVLDSGEEVKIRGLGTLCWRLVSERPCSGVKSGSSSPPGKKLKFIPAKRFRSRRAT